MEPDQASVRPYGNLLFPRSLCFIYLTSCALFIIIKKPSVTFCLPVKVLFQREPLLAFMWPSTPACGYLVSRMEQKNVVTFTLINLELLHHK